MDCTEGYVDLQVNGYRGVDFNNPANSLDDLIFAARNMLADGVAAALPTVITGPVDGMLRCISNLRQAIDSDAIAARIYQGLHLEGPFLSPQVGYIGAHPVEHALSCDPAVLEQLLDAAFGLARIVTLAPEIDTEAKLTRVCVERGIVVAAGHTDASLTQLETCIDAGLSLFTHLGNGCPRLMDRHDNIIYRALRFRDRLRYSLIADGSHIPSVLFKNFLDWIPVSSLLVVSDAISAAGLGPGEYRLGDRSVRIGSDKVARDVAGEHFVGSACTMGDADDWLRTELHLDLATRHQLLVENPNRLLAGRSIQ